MSVYFHRAIGWSMPWTQFLDHFKTAADSGTVSETLTARFNVAGDDLVVPEDYRRITKPGFLVQPSALDLSPTGAPHLEERFLLSRRSTLRGAVPPEFGHGRDLFELVWSPDHQVRDVLFFPNLIYRQHWLQTHTPVDIAFEQAFNDQKSDGERSFTVYVDKGHPPFTSALMHPNGARATYDYLWNGPNATTMSPAVPLEIVWYMKKLGILPTDAIRKLRPALAQWWA